MSSTEKPRKPRSKRWIVGLALVFAFVLLGIWGSGPEKPPPPGEVNVQSFAKVYLTSTGKWLVMVSYASALPDDSAALAREAAGILAHLSKDLDAAGVDEAVFKVTKSERYFFVTISKPRAAFVAHRRPDGTWKLDES